jgi:hypothetical protein
MSTAIYPLYPRTPPIYQPIQDGEPTAASSVDLSDPFSAGLTPDGLMAYCQAHLDSIDSQVRSSFDSQQRGAADVARINKVLADLKDAPPNGTDGNFDRCAALETSLGSAITDLQASDPHCPALPGLIQTYNNMVWSGTGGTLDGKSFPGPAFIDVNDYPPDRSQGSQGDKNLSGPELQGFGQAVQDAAGTINSQSELQLIQLQSLMSQRQTAISLTTNLVQSLGDQQNKIAENIGH